MKRERNREDEDDLVISLKKACVDGDGGTLYAYGSAFGCVDVGLSDSDGLSLARSMLGRCDVVFPAHVYGKLYVSVKSGYYRSGFGAEYGDVLRCLVTALFRMRGSSAWTSPEMVSCGMLRRLFPEGFTESFPSAHVLRGEAVLKWLLDDSDAAYVDACARKAWHMCFRGDGDTTETCCVCLCDKAASSFVRLSCDRHSVCLCCAKSMGYVFKCPLRCQRGSVSCLLPSAHDFLSSERDLLLRMSGKSADQRALCLRKGHYVRVRVFPEVGGGPSTWLRVDEVVLGGGGCSVSCIRVCGESFIVSATTVEEVREDLPAPIRYGKADVALLSSLPTLRFVSLDGFEVLRFIKVGDSSDSYIDSSLRVCSLSSLYGRLWSTHSVFPCAAACVCLVKGSVRQICVSCGECVCCACMGSISSYCLRCRS